MRISDWSSDVCSSDLLASVVEPATQRTGRGGCECNTRWPTPVVSLSRQLPYDGLQAWVQEKNVSEILRLLFCASQHYLTAWTKSTPTSPRSEEHTSELQSLMRISYAVF